MKKNILFITIQLLLCALAFAQTDDPGCSLYATTSDPDCLPALTCTYNAGYTSVSFTVVCKDWYTIKAWTNDTQADCAHCASCVAIYQNGQFIDDVTTAGVPCSGGDCCKTKAVQLTAGSYELRVSLRACNTVDIETCCETFPFRAYGSITTGIVNCP